MSHQDAVRFAISDADKSACYQLRYQVYVESMGRFSDKGDHDLKELRDDLDVTARSVIALKNDKPIGTLRLFWGGDTPFSEQIKHAYRLNKFLDTVDEKAVCVIERLMVIEQHRRSTTTGRLYQEVMKFVLKNRIEAVFISCEPHHFNAYLKLGFRPFSAPYSYPGIGLVIPMVLIAGDYLHLKAMGSPFSILNKDTDLDYCKSTTALLALIDSRASVTPSASDDFLKSIYTLTHAIKPDEQHFFKGLSDDEINRVIEKSYIINCNKGDRIIEKDNAAKTLFIVLSGAAEVRIDGRLVALIKAGEMIGEIAFFLNTHRTASVIAATETVRLLSLDEAALNRLIKFDPDLSHKLLINMCKSLCAKIINS